LFNISVITLGITYLERGQSAQLKDLNLRDVNNAYLLYFNESVRSTDIYTENYNCLLDIREQEGDSSKYWLINYDLHQELKEPFWTKVKLNYYRKGKLIADEFKSVEEPNGIYKGWWLDGKKHGKGTFKWSNSNQYVGDWVHNMRHGKGTFKWSNGNQYAGEWVDNKRHGKGTLKWSDGDQYIGEWVNSMRHGEGTLKWSDGDQYIGEWVNDMRHGQGKMLLKGGTVQVGEWINDQIQPKYCTIS